MERRPPPRAPRTPTSEAESDSPDPWARKAADARPSQQTDTAPWAGFGEALRDRDAIAEAWHTDSTDASRAAATAAASLALGHYAVALAPAMLLNYAVFLEAHVRSHLPPPSSVLAWQWHLCAAAWLMDQTFASTPGTTVTEHLEGAFSDLDL